MPIHNRIQQIIISDLEMSIASFERSIGVKPSRIQQVLKYKRPVDHEIIVKIISVYPQYSADYLLFGKENPHKEFIKKIIMIQKILKL